MDSGLLYIVYNEWIRDPETRKMPYKIGITKYSVSDRYYGLGLKMPGKFETLFAYKLDNYAEAEKAIGTIFSKNNINGEWYDLDEDDIALIEANCKKMHGKLVTDEIIKEIETETGDKIDAELFSETKIDEIKPKNETIEKNAQITIQDNDKTRKKMGKSDAINIINRKYSLRLNNRNTIFSNINKKWPHYWFDVPNERFRHDFNIVLYNGEEKIIYYFEIKENDMAAPERIFRQRNDDKKQNLSSITIDYRDNEFKDKYSHFSFLEYLKYEIELNV
jgi:hypothetical protein